MNREIARESTSPSSANRSRLDGRRWNAFVRTFPNGANKHKPSRKSRPVFPAWWRIPDVCWWSCSINEQSISPDLNRSIRLYMKWFWMSILVIGRVHDNETQSPAKSRTLQHHRKALCDGDRDEVNTILSRPIAIHWQWNPNPSPTNKLIIFPCDSGVSLTCHVMV